MTQGETNVEHRHSSDELMLGIAKVFTLARLAGWYVHLSSAQSDWIELELRKREDTREDSWLLSQVWLQRFAYRQLFSIVLFRTVRRAIDGKPFAWDKLERTAEVTYQESEDTVQVP